MEQKRLQEENLKRIKKKKKHLLHYLLIYLVCLLAACITWILVRYSMREERTNDAAEASLTAVAADSTAYGEGMLYV